MTSTISSLITSTERGDSSAAEALFVALYDELHLLAERQLARNLAGGTLGATTLLHEAYLDMSRREGTEFPSQGHFMAYAAKVMRGLIINYARERKAVKRGGRFELTTLDEEVVPDAADASELAEVGTALDALGAVEPCLAEIVDLKFFCGFSFAEIAAMRGVTERTVQRHWEKARIYLHAAIRSGALS